MCKHSENSWPRKTIPPLPANQTVAQALHRKWTFSCPDGHPRVTVPGLDIVPDHLPANFTFSMLFLLSPAMRRPRRGRPVGLAAWLLLALALPVRAEGFALAAATGSATPPGVPETVVQKAVARRVVALIGYTRWPAPPDPHRLCIVGDSRHAALLQVQAGEPAGHRLAVRAFAEAEAPAADCDVLYLGAMRRASREAILARWAAKPVLTIGEDEECAGALMFCLAVRDEGVSMRANLDSISRAGVKVNASVLNLFGRRRLPE